MQYGRERRKGTKKKKTEKRIKYFEGEEERKEKRNVRDE